ncbi:MAG: stage V sporulation protein AC [Acutalibacteraceae bacterium]|nr:stage V sporulation protein AC [Acutalibacteraceae bacterium]
MKISKKQYSEVVKKASPPSSILKDCIWAFVVGGFICVIGELLMKLYAELGAGQQQVKMLIPVTLIFLTALLTALKVFDNIGKKAGAGTLVPITGFANAVASAAIEFKTEGWILGLGAKIFTIAGPVIVYGTVASVIYGIIYWICLNF